MIKFVQKQLSKVIVWIVSNIGTYFLCKYFKVEFLFSLLFSLITSGFVLFLSKTWLEDYRISLNKEIQMYKAKLDGCTLVTKLQFELEFKIYTEIYEGLAEVQKEVIQLAPMEDYSTSESIYLERYNNFAKSINDIILKKIKYRPFYTKEIHSRIKKMIDLCSEEGTNFRCAYIEKLERFDFKESKKRKKEIENELEILSDLIKNRIQNMKIIE